VANLIVALNGIQVGVLTQGSDGSLRFRYLPEWLQMDGARAISLSLPLKKTPHIGPSVFNFFENLLPDADAIRARMQVRFEAPTRHPFDLLSRIGRDCIGAIQLYPEFMDIPDVRTVTADPLDDHAIARILSRYQEDPLGMNQDTDFRISLAGAQEKTALLWHQDQWQRPVGSTPTSHIFKLPIGLLEQRNIDLRESNENEWLCLRILAAYGMPVANAELASFEGNGVLVVERFDRRWSRDDSWLMRLPQEDFCQALGIAPALKYENEGGPGIEAGMKLLLGSQQAHRDRNLFFKAQILFWLMAAIDGHAKNFSLFIKPHTAIEMTPLYDVLSAYPLMAQGSLPPERTKMAMSVKGKNRHYDWPRIEARHFISTAQQVGFSAEFAKAMIRDIAERTDTALARVEAQLPPGFPVHISEPILSGIRRQATKLMMG